MSGGPRRPGRSRRKLRESDALKRETWEMEAKLRELQAKVDEERAAAQAASKSGGPRWGAAARTRGPITTYAKDLLAQAEPAAERRAQRQVNLRKAASERAAATQHVQHRAPPAQAPAPASNIPALELGAARQVAAAPAPPSARGTVAGGLQPAKAHLWSTGDVGDWLASLGLAKYVSTFAENEVSGAVLLDVGKEDLDYLEVKALAHRKLLLKAIARLATAVQTGQDEAAAAPTPRGGGSRAGGGGVAAEAAPAPAPAMVHWSQASSGMAPVAGPGEGTAAPANPLAAAAAAEHDEEAERSAFKEAVMAWRRGGTAAPEAPAGVAVANAGTDTAWSNPAEAPAGAGKASADGSRGGGGGGRFAASLGASTNQGSGGAFAATLGQAPAPATGNPLLAPGPSEEAEHAAFRDAVLAWRGQAPAAPAQPASASTAAGTSSGGKVGSASVGLGEKAAKVLGVDPATVEESSWYTGYKHLFKSDATGAAADVEAFTAHVKALHASRKQGAPQRPSPAASPETGTTSTEVQPSSAAAAPSPTRMLVEEEGGEAKEAVVESPGGAVEQGEVLQFDDLAEVPGEEGAPAPAPAAYQRADGTLSLVDESALSELYTPPARVQPQAAPARPTTSEGKRSATPRDIWSLPVDY